MSAIQPCPADHPSVWKAADIGGREGLTHRLGRAHLMAIRDLGDAIRGMPVAEIKRDSFHSPALADLMAAARDVVLNGRGAVILSGLDVEGLPLEDFERIYWYLGTYLGNGVIQSGKHDLVGRVRHETDSRARGYTTDVELRPHTDYHEILSLACYQKASEGGESGLASALAVHNILLEERPDLLETLYAGYYNGIPYRFGVNDSPHSQRKVPFYSSTDGKVSVFTLSFPRDAAAQRGEAVPEKLIEADTAMREIARREDIQARFMLEPGEMVFWNNRINFHARSRFTNVPGHERLLLRLWIDVPNGRPVHPEVAAAAEMVVRYHKLGMDHRDRPAG